jgi:dihydroorotate dehydrogenase (NAD+) catalytic subunit
LENPGIPAFISEKLTCMTELGTVIIANLSGSCQEDYAEGARLLDKSAVDMI